MEWKDNYINGNNIPLIMKVVHIGDFIEILYEEDSIYGGYITTLTSDSPEKDNNKNKFFLIGLGTIYSNNNPNETVLWTSKIKKFRIIHKGWTQ